MRESFLALRQRQPRLARPTAPAIPPGGVLIVTGRCRSDQTSLLGGWLLGASISTAHRACPIASPHHVLLCAVVVVSLRICGTPSVPLPRGLADQSQQAPTETQTVLLAAASAQIRTGTLSTPPKGACGSIAGPPRQRLPSSRPYRKCRGAMLCCSAWICTPRHSR